MGVEGRWSMGDDDWRMEGGIAEQQAEAVWWIHQGPLASTQTRCRQGGMVNRRGRRQWTHCGQRGNSIFVESTQVHADIPLQEHGGSNCRKQMIVAPPKSMARECLEE